jgi:Glycosyl hydrolases family 2, TIM barrel domain
VRLYSRRRLALIGLSALGICLLARPLLGLGHELAVAGVAIMLHSLVASNVWQPLVRGLGLDPVYADAAIHAAGGVQVVGIAVANPLGALLHSVFPALCLSPDHVRPGAAFSMVARAGAPALGRGLAAFGADVLWLAIGIWLFAWGHRNRSWRLSLLGLFVQAQVGVIHLLDTHIPLADVDASGIPFALEVAVPGAGWVTGNLANMPAEERDLMLGAILLLAAYAFACVLVLSAKGLRHAFRFARSRDRRREQLAAPLSWRLRTMATVGLALLTAWSPIGALAVGSSNWALDDVVLPSSTTAPHAPGRAHTLRVSGATPVTVVQQPDGTWQYLVDGVPEEIKGVGYNPWYASLSPADRTNVYNRDFAEMHNAGINTIEGWFENQFDSVTLDAAARNGIGVMMPFELNQDWDYTDPNVQQQILDRVSAYVETYKDHPAVRMWAPGNENLHRILYAHWVSQANVPAAQAKATALAAFLPKIVDRIHELDPNHPVVYRDAEDVYLPWIVNAFSQSGGDARPWLIYGANVYSDARLQQIIGSWPTQWPGHALLISEYAPGGMSSTDRPRGFQHQWAQIMTRPGVVLGGLAYTWATNGPEDLDRVFGFVDPSGTPTDGALSAVSAAYLSVGGG